MEVPAWSHEPSATLGSERHVIDTGVPTWQKLTWQVLSRFHYPGARSKSHSAPRPRAHAAAPAAPVVPVAPVASPTPAASDPPPADAAARIPLKMSSCAASALTALPVTTRRGRRQPTSARRRAARVRARAAPDSTDSDDTAGANGRAGSTKPCHTTSGGCGRCSGHPLSALSN